jgi:hypothetical protein
MPGHHHDTRRRLPSLAAALALALGTTVASIASSCDREELAGSAARTAAASTTPTANAERHAAAPERRQWEEAYALIARLADSGSAAGARLALEMHRHGKQIYGVAFEASSEQLQHWQRQLDCESPPCAGFG